MKPDERQVVFTLDDLETIHRGLGMLAEYQTGQGGSKAIRELDTKVRLMINPTEAVHFLVDDGDGGVCAPCGAFHNRGQGDGTTNAQKVTCPECKSKTKKPR